MTFETHLQALRTGAPAGIVEGVALATGLAAGFAVFEAPVGEVAVVFTSRGVRAVRLVEEMDPTAIEANPPTEWGGGLARAVAEGRPGDLPLDLTGVSPFRRRILELAGTIPRGEVRSYGWLAGHVGKPGAARAVGSAMASNPVPLIVPCHRVVRSDGHIGEYSLGGPENKWVLLRHEGADPEGLEELARTGTRFVGSDTTSIFCVPSCRNARRIAAPHRVAFGTAASALEAGFRPCHVCRPAPHLGPT